MWLSTFPTQKNTHHQQAVIGEISSGQSIAALVVEIHVIRSEVHGKRKINAHQACILKVHSIRLRSYVSRKRSYRQTHATCVYVSLSVETHRDDLPFVAPANVDGDWRKNEKMGGRTLDTKFGFCRLWHHYRTPALIMTRTYGGSNILTSSRSSCWLEPQLNRLLVSLQFLMQPIYIDCRVFILSRVFKDYVRIFARVFQPVCHNLPSGLEVFLPTGPVQEQLNFDMFQKCSSLGSWSWCCCFVTVDDHYASCFRPSKLGKN